MNIIFLSNYFNHHQKPLSDKFAEFTQGKYAFVANSEMRDERKQLGYLQTETPDYVFNVDQNDAIKNLANQIVINADAVITGSAPKAMIKPRIKAGKLTFRYSERPLKFGIEPLKFLPRLIKWHIENPINKPIYLLCASAYAASDYAKFGLFNNKAYKWGYFPETKTYDNINDLIKTKSKNTILWCGRFLKLKHPTDVIIALKRLRDNGYEFVMNFIGVGEEQNAMQQMIANYNLNDCVHMLGAMRPERVREQMEKSGVYLFTSDRQEGWGAVLNEAMNSGCAVVASHEIGSVPYLINDGKNGLIYKSQNVDMLYEKIKYLLDNPEQQEILGEAAYNTIINEWNAEVAAERFINLAEHILSGEKYPDLYKSGPCSKAEIFDDRWYKE